MPRKVILHREYKTCSIAYDDRPGVQLRWSSFTPDTIVRADTLEGVKRLISAEMDPPSRHEVHDLFGKRACYVLVSE